MIIKIEDAPSIKHIKIDIDFDDGEPSVSINKDTNNTTFSEPTTHSTPITQKKSIMDDIKLDMDETFEVPEEIIEKPEIPDHDRDVKVASDMESLEI